MQSWSLNPACWAQLFPLLYRSQLSYRHHKPLSGKDTVQQSPWDEHITGVEGKLVPPLGLTTEPIISQVLKEKPAKLLPALSVPKAGAMSFSWALQNLHSAGLTEPMLLVLIKWWGDAEFHQPSQRTSPSLCQPPHGLGAQASSTQRSIHNFPSTPVFQTLFSTKAPCHHPLPCCTTMGLWEYLPQSPCMHVEDPLYRAPFKPRN